MTEHEPGCPKSRPALLRPLAECECYADILNDQRERFSKTLDELFSRGPHKKEDTMSEERDIVEQVRLIKLSGSLAPFAIDKLEEAASEITRLRGEVERLRGALTCIAGYEDMTAFEWERKFPVANIIMAPLDPSEVSEGLCEIARSVLNIQEPR